MVNMINKRRFKLILKIGKKIHINLDGSYGLVFENEINILNQTNVSKLLTYYNLNDI